MLYTFFILKEIVKNLNNGGSYFQMVKEIQELALLWKQF